MERYVIEVEIKSNTMFGCGQSSANKVDTEILYDEYGFPYYKAKTLKGKLREEMEAIAKILKDSCNIDLYTYIENLLGREGNNSELYSILSFSNLTFSENLIKALERAIEEKMCTQEDILLSLTDIRSFTRIDEAGVAGNGSLRQARVLKPGFKLYTTITSRRELSNVEKGLLSGALLALRNIGAMESRGMGNISAKLLRYNKDVTYHYLQYLENEVK